MTPTTCLQTGPANRDAFDPFVAPLPTYRIIDAPLRSRVVIEGFVVDAAPSRWSGGAVLEVTLSDGTGQIRLVFLGRRAIAGVEPARLLTAAGTVGLHHGRRVVLNPTYWLQPSEVEARRG